jgi:tetratricopeptide (TPR) repeat protein
VARRTDRRPLVALGWMFLTYLPASNLITPTGQSLADRTLFGATVGVALLIAVLLDVLPSFGRKFAMVVVALVAIRGALTSTRYAVAWTSHRALWTRLMETSPNEHLSYKLLGMDARARGETARAVELLGRAFAMAPTDRQIRFELGQALYTAGRYPEAVSTLKPLVADADARSESGFIALFLDASGRAGGPEAVVRAATPLLRSETGAVAALFLGTALEQLGRRAQADSVYAFALARSPGDSALRARSQPAR